MNFKVNCGAQRPIRGEGKLNKNNGETKDAGASTCMVLHATLGANKHWLTSTKRAERNGTQVNQKLQMNNSHSAWRARITSADFLATK